MGGLCLVLGPGTRALGNGGTVGLQEDAAWGQEGRGREGQEACWPVDRGGRERWLPAALLGSAHVHPRKVSPR